jgi:serine O-acetyltransferase
VSAKFIDGEKSKLGIWALVKSDLSRFAEKYREAGKKYSKLRIVVESILFKAGFQAVFLYRISHWLYQKKLIYLAWFFTRLNIFLTGAEIEFNASIGPGFCIVHPVGIVVGRGAQLGCQLTLFQGATIGIRSWRVDQIDHYPIIGNRCFIFAHGVVAGGITLADDCVIGANAVALTDQCAGSVIKAGE